MEDGHTWACGRAHERQPHERHPPEPVSVSRKRVRVRVRIRASLPACVGLDADDTSNPVGPCGRAQRRAGGRGVRVAALERGGTAGRRGGAWEERGRPQRRCNKGGQRAGTPSARRPRARGRSMVQNHGRQRRRAYRAGRTKRCESKVARVRRQPTGEGRARVSEGEGLQAGARRCGRRRRGHRGQERSQRPVHQVGEG